MWESVYKCHTQKCLSGCLPKSNYTEEQEVNQIKNEPANYKETSETKVSGNTGNIQQLFQNEVSFCFIAPRSMVLRVYAFKVMLFSCIKETRRSKMLGCGFFFLFKEDLIIYYFY